MSFNHITFGGEGGQQMPSKDIQQLIIDLKKAKSDDDYALEGDLFRPDNDTPLEGRLAPGKKKRGAVTFQAPEGWQTTELHFKPNLWADGEIVFAATNDEVQP